MRKEKKDPASKVAIYAMVDLDNQHAYALKVQCHGLTWRINQIKSCSFLLSLLLLILGYHNDSHLQCYRVLPPAEWRLQGCNYFNKPRRSRWCINESEYNTYNHTQFHAITHYHTHSYTIYLLRFLWTVSSLSTGVCLVQPRLMELVYFYSLVLLFLWTMCCLCIYMPCHLQRSFPSMARATCLVLTTGRLRQKDLQKWRLIIISIIFGAYWLRILLLPVMQAPGLPGEYEVRYSPNSLRGTYTGMRGNTYIAVARFTVDTVWNQKN